MVEWLLIISLAGGTVVEKIPFDTGAECRSAGQIVMAINAKEPRKLEVDCKLTERE